MIDETRRLILQTLSGVSGIALTQPFTKANAQSADGKLPGSPVWKVASVKELHEATIQANSQLKGVTIALSPGTYRVERTIAVRAPGTRLIGDPEHPDQFVIEGQAMSAASKIGNVIWIGAAACELSGITIRWGRHHCVQVAGEHAANGLKMHHCVFQDSFEQLVKVSALPDRKRSAPCRNGIIEHCLFEYTAGIGPQYYIAGFDGHHCENWAIRNNVFRHIASPSKMVAEQAVHFWGVRNVLVENNLIINCDRGIQLGIGQNHGVESGVIRNNVIWHADNDHRFADVGISTENCQSIHVVHNTVIQNHGYPNAIEVRFPTNRDGSVRNNLTNRSIRIRDGAQADINHNQVDRSLGRCITRPPATLGDLGQGCERAVRVPLNEHAPFDLLGKDRRSSETVRAGAVN